MSELQGLKKVLALKMAPRPLLRAPTNSLEPRGQQWPGVLVTALQRASPRHLPAYSQLTRNEAQLVPCVWTALNP